MPRRHHHQVCSGRFLERDVVRQRHDVAGGHDDLLGVRAHRAFAQDGVINAQLVFAAQAVLTLATTQRGINGHALALVQAAHVLADRRNHAGPVGAGHVRQLEFQAWPTLAHEQVEPVQRAGLNVDQHVEGADARRRQFGGLQHVKSAMLVEDDGFQTELRFPPVFSLSGPPSRL